MKVAIDSLRSSLTVALKHSKPLFINTTMQEITYDRPLHSLWDGGEDEVEHKKEARESPRVTSLL